MYSVSGVTFFMFRGEGAYNWAGRSDVDEKVKSDQGRVLLALRAQRSNLPTQVMWKDYIAALAITEKEMHGMRLGGPVFGKDLDPERWVEALKVAGYRAAYCPVANEASPELIEAYVAAAAQADIVIAEVGAWSNPLSADEGERQKAMNLCKRQLALADAIGARCCVNIAGSRGTLWDGPHPLNLTRETFEMIVAQVREIIDEVQPRRAFYALETMPWIYPDSPDSYLELINAIDREQFAVHLDPVNLVCSPQRYFKNGALIHECFSKLGPYIKSVHAKDILLSDRLTTHLDEVRPGLGFLDYRTFLDEMKKLPADTSIMLEHLQTEEEYRQAAEYVRSVASDLDIIL
jgi:sugar phosphate isomerase/epimerase